MLLLHASFITAGFVGLDRCSYTADNAVAANITINVTAGSCDVNQCGFNLQSGSCSQGRCTCPANAGMLPTNVMNPNKQARSTQRYIPACRYRQLVLVSGFSPALVTSVRSGDMMRIVFRVAKDAAAAVCVEPSPLVAVRMGKMEACPTKRAGAAAVAPEEDLDFTVDCANGEYTANVSVPGAPGACGKLAVWLADGTARRGVVKVVA